MENEYDDRDVVEYEDTTINKIRNATMIQNIAKKEPKTNKIVDLYDLFQKSKNCVGFETAQEIV